MLDLDADGVADTLFLHHVPDQVDPGAYDRLDLVLSRSGDHYVEGLWDPSSDQWPTSDGNLVNSSAIYVRRFPKAGTLIFLFGEDVDPGQRLTIYRVTAGGVEKYFDSDVFFFTQPIRADSSSDGVMTGTYGSEGVLDQRADTLEAVSYSPTFVYTLGERAALDSAASAAATRRDEGGFAGFMTPDYLWSVQMCDGTRFVLDTRTRRRIP